MANLSNISATAYSGPPEYDPNTLYYVCQMNANGPNTFRLTSTKGDDAGTHAITVSTSFQTLQSLVLSARLLSYNPAPGGPSAGGQNQQAHSAYSYFRGAMRETDRIPVTVTNPAVSWPTAMANVEAWNMVDFTALSGPTGAAFRYDVDASVKVV